MLHLELSDVFSAPFCVFIKGTLLVLFFLPFFVFACLLSLELDLFEMPGASEDSTVRSFESTRSMWSASEDFL